MFDFAVQSPTTDANSAICLRACYAMSGTDSHHLGLCTWPSLRSPAQPCPDKCNATSQYHGYCSADRKSPSTIRYLSNDNHIPPYAISVPRISKRAP
eukprot:3232952-Rhodomonas_salina.1